MRSLFDLTGKTAVLIGGNSTLGSVMAEALGAHGAQVAIVGRNVQTAAEVVTHLQQSGYEAKAFQADATKKQDVFRICSEILAWSGQVDILMNCPGKNSATPFFEITEEEWDEIMDVNLLSILLSCQVFSKQMIEQGTGGSIINISSVSSGPPLSRVLTYSVSKAGVNSLTQYLAREFAPYQIRVNGIIPGFFPAEQNKKILSEERIAQIMSHTPMNRFGKPEELQGAAVYLASERASGFVTGTFLRVDGGFGAITI